MYALEASPRRAEKNPPLNCVVAIFVAHPEVVLQLWLNASSRKTGVSSVPNCAEICMTTSEYYICLYKANVCTNVCMYVHPF